MHKELPQGDIQRIGLKVKLGEIIIESTDIECLPAEEILARWNESMQRVSPGS